MDQEQRSPVQLKQEAINNTYADEIVYSADWLVKRYGDEAFWKGVGMAISALKNGDKDQCRLLGKANVELIKRGYDKKPQNKK